MRILDFNEGDVVSIRKTNLRGTIIKIGGQKVTIRVDKNEMNKSSICTNDEIIINISRLRHVASLYERKIKQAEETIEKARKMIRRKPEVQ